MRKKVASYMIVLDEFKDTDYLDILKNKLIRSLKIDSLKKSVSVMNIKIIEGYNNDDFAYSQFTILAKGDAYKINRIIKNMLMKRLTV